MLQTRVNWCLAIVTTLGVLASGCSTITAEPGNSVAGRPHGEIHSAAISPKSLDMLRQATSLAKPVRSFALPTGAHFYDFYVPSHGVFAIDGTSEDGENLYLMDDFTGRVVWKHRYGPPGVFPDSGIGPEGYLLYAPEDGLKAGQGLAIEPKELLPYLGPGYIEVGDGGKDIYFIPKAEGTSTYSLVQPAQGTSPTVIDVGKPYRGLWAAKNTNDVLLSCPNLRLEHGNRLAWEYGNNECPDDAGISDDGTVVYSLFTTNDQMIVQLFDASGHQLWQKGLSSSTDGAKFASGGKRVWLWHRTPEGAIIQIVDASGRTVPLCQDR